MSLPLRALAPLTLVVACAAPEPAPMPLFDGTDLAAWEQLDGGPAAWEVTPEGTMAVVPSAGNLRTRASFGDHRIELEFLCPEMPKSLGIDRGNSGVYVHGIYEVQVLDSFGEELALNSCGAIYQISMPAVNASRPPEEWQSYVIDFRAPRFDDEGQVTEFGRMSVVHNGLLIQDDVELPHVTPGGMGSELLAEGPLMLQAHGHRVQYRNVHVTRLDEEHGLSVGFSFGAGRLED